MANLAANLAIALIGQLLYVLFAPKPDDIEGSRLEDLNVPAVSPGQPINRVFGTMKVMGQLLWTTGLVETRHETRQRGGKGGPPKPKVITYTYSTSVAIGICEGPIRSVRRILAQQKLIWKNPDLDESESIEDQVAAYRAERYNFYLANSGGIAVRDQPGGEPLEPPTTNARIANANASADRDAEARRKELTEESIQYDSLRIYTGTETQMPDPVIEQTEGVGNVPPFRGVAYFVIENLQLADFGNAIPQFLIEVEEREGEVSVYEIVVESCARVGLVLGDELEVSPVLRTMKTTGLAITQQTSVRDTIQYMREIHPFDAAEIGTKLIFAESDRDPVATIRLEDLRTFGDEGEGTEQPRMERVRIDDLQLPRAIRVEFQDPARDYSINQVTAFRQVSESNLIETVSLPVSGSTTVMKKAAEMLLARKISERVSYSISVPPKYVILRPGDVVRLPLERGGFKTARITKMDFGANFVIKMSLVDHVNSEASIVSRADTGDYRRERSLVPAGTFVHIMDTPSFDDEDTNDTGLYVAFSRDGPNWGGGALFRDTSAGVSVPVFGSDLADAPDTSYTQVAASTFDVPAGTALSVLRGDVSPYTVDRRSELVVNFRTPNVWFTSQTLTQAVASDNLVFYVGQELVQALTVENQGAGVWSFRDLIRGVRGTEWAMRTHVANEDVVALRQVGVSRLPLFETLINSTLVFKAATQGQDIGPSPIINFPFRGNNLRPFAPDLGAVTRDDDGNLSGRIIPRARFRGRWLSGEETVSDQTGTERFVIEVVDGNPWNLANPVVRTFNLEGSRDFLYTESQQVTDFASVQGQVRLRLYQIGAVVGRGFPRFLVV